ncbi:MAG: LacI family DNA-binding transcriptional regulator [Bacteroidia bacterium]
MAIPKRQITLADLAKELGISTATVSRALKDYPDISTETKQRVLELAHKWNYRPNSMAAGLRKRESKVIGVIVPSIVNHFFSAVIKGIMEVAYDHDYRVMLCQSDESYDKEVADAHALFNSRVDGLLVSIAHETDRYNHFDEFLDAGVPLVFFDKVPPDNIDHYSKVIVDDYEGAYRAVTHLIAQGLTRIAHFHGPRLASTSRNRLQGYLDAMQAYGLVVDPDKHLYACQQITLEEGQAFVHQLRDRDPDCQAIFAVTDTVAIGAITALKALGIAIPGQMRVVGFSDWEMSAIFEPSLSSVAQPGLEMGRIATRLLLKEIQAVREEQHTDPETIVLHTELRVRDSSRLVVVQP